MPRLSDWYLPSSLKENKDSGLPYSLGLLRLLLKLATSNSNIVNRLYGTSFHFESNITKRDELQDKTDSVLKSQELDKRNITNSYLQGTKIQLDIRL